MSIPNLFRGMGLAVLGVVLLAPSLSGQGPGRYELEYEGAVMGGATGVGATYRLGADGLVIELPAVVRSYPTIRFVRSAGALERPSQVEVGPASGAFTVEFLHPGLPLTYVGEGGSVRIVEVADGRIRGEFLIVASPVDSPGRRNLTFRGRFDATPAR